MYIIQRGYNDGYNSLLKCGTFYGVQISHFHYQNLFTAPILIKNLHQAGELRRFEIIMT
jgi:hypothetical protein